MREDMKMFKNVPQHRIKFMLTFKLKLINKTFTKLICSGGKSYGF